VSQCSRRERLIMGGDVVEGVLGIGEVPSLRDLIRLQNELDDCQEQRDLLINTVAHLSRTVSQLMTDLSDARQTIDQYEEKSWNRP
jgi:hypothetical protein